MATNRAYSLFYIERKIYTHKDTTSLFMVIKSSVLK